MDASRPPTWWWTRFWFLRLLGLVYATAFLILVHQGLPLIGENGLLPAHIYMNRIAEVSGAGWPGFIELPTVFWFDVSDTALQATAWLGLVLSIAVLCGVTNAIVMLLLWALYMSFCHIGQIWYGYGWEILLLETGFLAAFMCPLTRFSGFDRKTAPSPIVNILVRWLAFRIMFGAGLIKLRGDPCWTDLSCLIYHYETQPNPNPLSWWLHHRPAWFHEAGVLFNHFVELIAPWFIFGSRRWRHAAGVCLVLFQVSLIVSGNLSFLNWLTLCACIACFDDSWLKWLAPRRFRGIAPDEPGEVARPRRIAVGILAVTVALLSIGPIANMLSPKQAMNTSFDPLHLVNTYGAFGSVGKTRNEVVIQGTNDPTPGPDSEWLDYELPCKPGRLDRRPCLITPYHYRVDWQIWFAAMQQMQRNPWLVHLVVKILDGDPIAQTFMAEDPFDGQPPAAVRLALYRYEFTDPGESGWWRRTYRGEYLRPITRDDPDLRDYTDKAGWPRLAHTTDGTSAE